jgi:tetratricopeptide (TPR) repeat protein
MLTCECLCRNLLRAVAICALFIGVLFGQSALERAVTLAREKRYAEARELLKEVAEPTPLSQRIAFHRLKAAIAAGLGDGSTAAAEMQQALRLSPADRALLLATAMAEFQANHLDDALQHAKAVGQDATAKALVGDIEEKRGAFDEAVKAYREAVDLAPGGEAYRITLALDLIRHQTFDPAITLLRESAALFPHSARVRTLLGIALYANGDVEEATASLVDAIAADSSSASARLCLAQIVLQSSAPPARSVVDTLCGWNATVCSALKLRIARENGDLAMQSEAIAGLKRAPAADPIARCELARAYDWTNRLEDARQEMEACVKSDASPQNHYRMGLIYRRLGLNDLARKEMDLRARTLQKMTEETAAGLNSLKSFQ